MGKIGTHDLYKDVLALVVFSASMALRAGVGCAIGSHYVLTATEYARNENLEVSFGEGWISARVEIQNIGEGWSLLALEGTAPHMPYICRDMPSDSHVTVHGYSDQSYVPGSMFRRQGRWVFSEELYSLPPGSPIFLGNGSRLIAMVLSGGKISIVYKLQLNIDMYTSTQKDNADNGEEEPYENSRRRGARFGCCTVRTGRESASANGGFTTAITGQTKKTYELVKESLVIIQSGDSSGSGFIVREGEKTYLITNEHVVRGARKLRAMKFSGEEIILPLKSDKNQGRAGSPKFAVSKTRDLVRFEIESSSALSMSARDPEIGSGVHVFGNSDGGGVCTLISGKALAVGPDKLEIDARFVPGNSGSPIVNDKGEVLGVATMVTWYNGRPAMLEGTRFGAKRWFGCRLNFPQWEPMEWGTYAVRADMVGDFGTYLKILSTFRMPDEEHIRDITLGYTESDSRQFVKTQFFHKLLMRVATTHKEVIQSMDESARAHSRFKEYDDRWHQTWRGTGDKEIREGREQTKRDYNRAKAKVDEKWKAYVSARRAAFTESRKFMKNKNWACPRLQEQVNQMLEDLDVILKRSNLNL